MSKVETHLKSERVQEPEALSAPVARLKSERVQEYLRSMPGWRLLPHGQAIGRVREFVDPDHAEAFAAFVARLSLTQRYPVTIDLTPSQVILVLRGTHETGDLNEAAFVLAAAIG
jgi:pterin-4a-carbinolamine dehydratase